MLPDVVALRISAAKRALNRTATKTGQIVLTPSQIQQFGGENFGMVEHGLKLLERLGEVFNFPSGLALGSGLCEEVKDPLRKFHGDAVFAAITEICQNKGTDSGRIEFYVIQQFLPYWTDLKKGLRYLQCEHHCLTFTDKSVSFTSALWKRQTLVH